jgi:hypothetical protein
MEVIVDFEDGAKEEALPKVKQRSPITYMVIHTHATTGEKVIKECENRREARKYINQLSNPETVEFIYRISAKIKLKRKVTVTMTW